MKKCSNVSGISGEGSELDAAHTWTIADHLELDVALIAPIGAPGVTDEVVWGTSSVGTVSNGSDGVVELGSATSSIIQDSRLVVLEGWGGGIDGDGDNTLGNCSLEVRLTSLFDGAMGCNLSGTSVGDRRIASWEASSA